MNREIVPDNNLHEDKLAADINNLRTSIAQHHTFNLDSPGISIYLSIYLSIYICIQCLGPQFPEFLLPFRKPKRIRTAFSPSQLLKLEQAFEKNQYVVGQERKELAKSLNLSETQVCSGYSYRYRYK